HKKAHDPEPEQTGYQDGEPSWVMPGFDCSGAVMRADPNQNRRAHHITNKGENRAGDDEAQTTRNAEQVEFAEKKRDHKRRLKGPHSAAGFFNSNKTRADLDDVAVLQSRDASQLQKNDIQRRDRPHQILNDDLFDSSRPRD